MNSIILFDGECNFCDSSVQFIINRDPKGLFHFASLQSEAGQELLKKYDIPADIDSMVLIENEKAYYKSSAALRICRHLQGVWKLFFVFILIPSPIRHIIYDWIAKNRYKWFGKKESCMLPPPSILYYTFRIKLLTLKRRLLFLFFIELSSVFTEILFNVARNRRSIPFTLFFPLFL